MKATNPICMPESMKLAISGSRSNTTFDFSALFNYQNKEFNAFLCGEKISSIITGGARGIDKQAEYCAENLNISCQIVRPDYAKYQKGAPLKRNQQIIEQCDALLVIWNGNTESRGTIFTALHALKSGKPVFVVIAAGENIDSCIGEIHDAAVFLAGLQ